MIAVGLALPCQWIDWFVLANIILIVFVTAMSLAIIWFEESPDPLVSCLSEVLDMLVKRTQPIAAMVFNGVLILLGFYNARSMPATGPPAVDPPGRTADPLLGRCGPQARTADPLHGCRSC